MTSFGGNGLPGMGAAEFTSEREIVAQGFEQNRAVYKSIVISGATRDAGNSPTTVLRPGLLLGLKTSTGEYEEWDADAVDGTQDIRAILWKELRAQDFNANNTDRHFTAFVGGNVPLLADKLLIQGTAFTSSADEFLARRQLQGSGFVLDDDPMGYLSGTRPRFDKVTATSDTLTESQNGTLITYSNAAAVTVTLPAIHPGLEFTLLRTGDEEFVVQSAEGNNVLVGNNLTTADKITFTQAGEHIGAGVRVKGIYVGTTPMWLMEVMTVPLGTGLDAWTYAIGTS